MTTLEQRELKGITLKNLLITVISTASIVASVMTTYFQLRADIHEVSLKQEAQSRVDELRLKTLETQVGIIQRQMSEIKNQYAIPDQSKIYPEINNSLNQ